MKNFLTVLLILLLAITASAKYGVDSNGLPYQSRTEHQSLDQEWGPDTFGYIARDASEPDGPDAAWMDISTVGTQVTGLTDDNFVGPFSMGWSFRYYWYDVSQFWVGSNGYIKFSTAGQLAQPFANIPAAAAPNDVVGPYIADWFFGAPDPSECWYWSNNEDTLIVMWKNVTAWEQGGNLGNHNFELILSGVDSSITFQYGSMTASDVSNNNFVVGIENLTGQIGISNYFGAPQSTTPTPPQNNAIKFYYPNPVTYTVHDLAMAAVQNVTSGGFFLVQGDSLTPWLNVRNAGNQTEATYSVNYAVRTVSNTLLAQDDTTMGTITPAQNVNITYPPLWEAAAPNVFRLVGTVTLAGDIFAANNSIRTELHTVTLPGELFYDDNSSNRDWGWAGGTGGMANEFVPPVYPCEIVSVRAYVSTSLPDGFDIQVIDDDGANGSPGTILWSEHIADPPAASWSSATLPDQEVIITSGSFYVAWMQSAEGITFGMDTTSAQGIARRSWESAGTGWGENRLAQEADPMIRATVRSPGTINHPPVITDQQPTDLDTVAFNSFVTFEVTAEDEDNDPLTYEWTLNGGAQTSDADTARIRFLTLGANEVMCIVSDFEFSDTATWNVWCQLISDADDLNPLLPTEFSLGAYPNPFNPAVKLAYDVPELSDVSLKIYNLTGEEVTTLVNDMKAPGRYEVEWNGSANATGTYFAVLSTASTTKIQKLLLLK